MRFWLPAILFVIGLLLIWYAWQVLLLAFGAILFALFLDGLTDLVTRWTPLPRKWALTLVILVLTAVTIGTGFLIGPGLAAQASEVAQQVPQAWADLQKQMQASPAGERILQYMPSGDKIIPSGSDMMGRITGWFNTFTSALIAVLFILAVGIYLAAERHLHMNLVIKATPRRHRRKAEELMSDLGSALKWWLVGRIASMAVVGVLTIIGLWAIGMELAISLGLIAAILSFIPNLGPILSWAPAALLAATHGPTMVLWVTGVYVLVQWLESYFITPLIQKKAVTLPPAAIITVQLLMGVLAGILGVLLATPLLVVATVVTQVLYIRDALDKPVDVLGETGAGGEGDKGQGDKGTRGQGKEVTR